MFFDTHLHFDLLSERTRKPVYQLLDESRAVGVSQWLTLATKVEDFSSLIEKIAPFSPNLRLGLGLHPLWIEAHQEADLLQLDHFLHQKKGVAVGEIGLDRGVPQLGETALWQKQQFFFIEQLKLAEKYELPVVIHSRKTHAFVLQILKKYCPQRGGIIHGFSGSLEEAKKFIHLGLKIGVGGVITYERAKKTRRAIATLPLEHLVLETDSPEMPLSGKQGEVNVPQNIKIIFETLCELKNISQEERFITAEKLRSNSTDLLGHSK